MDEILASIRKIIAEEPAGARSGPDSRSVNPLLSGTELRTENDGPANDRPPPSLDRLSSALRAKAPETPLVKNAPRASTFDEDLADLIDDPLPAPRPVSATPTMNGLSGLDALRASANAEEGSVDAAAAPAQAEPPASAPVRPAGMGALRTSSFYPPKGFAAGAPKPKPMNTTALFQSLSSGVSPASAASQPSAPAIDGFAGVSDIAPPAESGVDAAMAALDDAVPQLSAFEALSQAEPPAETPVSPAPAHHPVLPPISVETVRADGFPSASLFWERESQHAPVQNGHWHGPNGNGNGAAAASPFDALARSLAAVAMDQPARQIARAADIPSLATLIAQPLLPATRDAHELPARTLEDAVADMLKPLLQQWLADNMPRIIERALRVEAASSLRPPQKPYGS